MAPFEKVDFVGRWRVWFAISGFFLLASILAIGLGRLNFGIDFVGGSDFTLTDLDRPATVEQVRGAHPAEVRGDPVVQRVGENSYEVRTPVLEQ